MEYSAFLEEIKAKFNSFDKLQSHISKVLNNRGQRQADYSRLPDNYSEAGVLFTLVLPKTVIDLNLNPIEHLHIIYEKRSERMNNHPGQMAFPGGTLEEIDENSPMKAAFREANEEIGIKQHDLQFISYMDEFVASSNILVYPVVAWLIEDLPIDNFHQLVAKKYYPRTSESTATVVMPLRHLLNPDHYDSRPYLRNGEPIGFIRYFYTTEIRPDDNIWGLTASMTRRFIDEVFPNHPLPDEILPQRN